MLYLFSLEVKVLLRENCRKFTKWIYSLKPGTDVTDTCFNECLEIAVEGNLHLAAGFIFLHLPSNATDCLKAAINHGHYETAVMLMLCFAATKNEIMILDLICRSSYEGKTQTNQIISLKLTPNQTFFMDVALLEQLRCSGII